MFSDMKKEKKYTPLDPSKNKAKEPMVAFQAPLMSALTHMSYHDIHEMRLSGRSLVDIQKQTSLSAQDIAGVVGVSKSKYYELVQMDDLSSKNIDALADFATLWQKGIDAFDGDDSLLYEWMETRNENLGNIKPVELLSSRVGRRALEKAYNRIEYSTYG